MENKSVEGNNANAMLDVGWISGNEIPQHTKDVIAMVTDGTFFMARHYYDTKWNFYFSDTGLKPDDTRRMKVVCWLPLERLPACDQTRV